MSETARGRVVTAEVRRERGKRWCPKGMGTPSCRALQHVHCEDSGFTLSEMGRGFEQSSAVICCFVETRQTRGDKGNPVRSLIIQARGGGDWTTVAAVEVRRSGRILDTSGKPSHR